MRKDRARERERHRWLQGDRWRGDGYHLSGNKKHKAQICLFFEDSQGYVGSAKSGGGADIHTTIKDLHTSIRNVRICLEDIRTCLENVIMFQCDC